MTININHKSKNRLYKSNFCLDFRKIIILFVLLTITSSTEGIFKLGKKKKFMEGFLMGFFIGNEFASHKANGGKGIPIEALAKHAMPFALKDTGVNTDDLTNLMLNMKSKSDSLPPKKTIMLRRIHAPRKIKIIRRIKPTVRNMNAIKALQTVKYPVFLKDTGTITS